MKLYTLDFETYYDKQYSLSKLTTEEYIRDPRFEVIGVGIKVDDGEVSWFSGPKEELHKHLLTYEWRDSALLCHNTMFDGAILKWFFNISPAMYLDTLCMARAVHGVEAGGSLASLAKRYEIGLKGEEVVAAINKKREDFSPEELARYGEYCKNDVALTYDLFNILTKDFSESELELIDLPRTRGLGQQLRYNIRINSCQRVRQARGKVQFVVADGLQLQDLFTHASREGQETVFHYMRLALGIHFQQDGIHAIQAGAGHQADVELAVRMGGGRHAREHTSGGAVQGVQEGGRMASVGQEGASR